MTLMNGFLAGRSASIYADCAWLGMPEGRIVAFKGKIILGGRWPFALATSFHSEADWIDGMMNRLGFDDPPGDVSALLDRMRGELAAFARGSPDSIGRVLIAAFDKSERRTRLFILATDDLGLGPLEPVELEAFVSSGNDTPEYERATRLGWNRKRMLAVIDAQRRQPLDNPLYGKAFGIGGTAVEIKVSEAGLSGRFVRRWTNDRVGELIAPG